MAERDETETRAAFALFASEYDSSEAGLIRLAWDTSTTRTQNVYREYGRAVLAVVADEARRIAGQYRSDGWDQIADAIVNFASKLADAPPAAPPKTETGRT